MNSQKRQLFRLCFIQNNNMHLNTSEPIHFKHCIMIDAINLNSLILLAWPRMSLTVTGLWESNNLCNKPVVKWQEVAETFATISYVKETTAESSCKYGKYGSYEHLLFVFSVLWGGEGGGGGGVKMRLFDSSSKLALS